MANYIDQINRINQIANCFYDTNCLRKTHFCRGRYRQFLYLRSSYRFCITFQLMALYAYTMTTQVFCHNIRTPIIPHVVPIIVRVEERLLTDCACIRRTFLALLHHKTYCSLSVQRQVHVENCRERHQFRRVGLYYDAEAVVLFFIRLQYTESPCMCTIWYDRTCILFVSYPIVWAHGVLSKRQ